MKIIEGLEGLAEYMITPAIIAYTMAQFFGPDIASIIPLWWVVAMNMYRWSK